MSNYTADTFSIGSVGELQGDLNGDPYQAINGKWGSYWFEIDGYVWDLSIFLNKWVRKWSIAESRWLHVGNELFLPAIPSVAFKVIHLPRFLSDEITVYNVDIRELLISYADVDIDIPSILNDEI